MDINWLYLLTGITYGWIEAFIMEYGFSTGNMDFLGFKGAYHGAMLLLILTIAAGMHCFNNIFWWILVEDLMFWASSKWAFSYKFKLTQDSWIAQKMGSLKYKNIMIPIIYIVLFIVGFLSIKYI